MTPLDKLKESLFTNNFECPVCYERTSTRTGKKFNCKHKLCDTCLQLLINSKLTILCPQCRAVPIDALW